MFSTSHDFPGDDDIVPTHVVSSGGVVMLCASRNHTCAARSTVWVCSHLDIEMASHAAVMGDLVEVHKLLRSVHERADPYIASQAREGGERAKYVYCSLFYYATYFLHVHPDTVYCPIGLLLRGTTMGLPAHLDADEAAVVVHYYVAGHPAIPQRDMAGNDVFVCSGRTGGKVVEFSSAAPPGELRAGTWTPSEMLHWVGTREGAHTLDPRQIRGIPFTNRWVHHCLQSQEHTPVRLAPLHPKARRPVTCTCCARVYASPDVDAVAWMNHFGALIQSSRRRPFICFDCCVFSVSAKCSNVFS